MTKKVPKKILRIERNVFVNLRKNCFWPPAPRRPPIFLTRGAAPPPPPPHPRRPPPPFFFLGGGAARAAAYTMTSAHSSNQGIFLLCLRKVYNCRETKNIG